MQWYSGWGQDTGDSVHISITTTPTDNINIIVNTVAIITTTITISNITETTTKK